MTISKCTSGTPCLLFQLYDYVRYQKVTDLLSVFIHMFFFVVLQVNVSSGVCEKGSQSSSKQLHEARGKIIIF